MYQFPFTEIRAVMLNTNHNILLIIMSKVLTRKGKQDKFCYGTAILNDMSKKRWEFRSFLKIYIKDKRVP